jgi:hypothetical protein
MGESWRLGQWLSSRCTKVRVRSGDFILNEEEKQVAADAIYFLACSNPATELWFTDTMEKNFVTS